MAQRFAEIHSGETRALQIWQILICKAANRQTITYGQLAKILGFKRAGTVGNMLGYILAYCPAHDLPPLTALVVNRQTGLPGKGFTIENVSVEQERVFRFDWFSLMPPTPDDFPPPGKITKATD